MREPTFEVSEFELTPFLNHGAAATHEVSQEVIARATL